jgi:hypothetical protein
LSANNACDEVINLTEENLTAGYFVTSRLFFGKIYRQLGNGQHMHDGFSIGIRTDLPDVERQFPKAYLFDDEIGCAVLIKDTKMLSVWAKGARVTSAATTEFDAAIDRASMLVDGQVPPHYILVRFPPGMRLKNVFAPMQVGC